MWLHKRVAALPLLTALWLLTAVAVHPATTPEDSLITLLLPAGIVFTPMYFSADPEESGNPPRFAEPSSCSDYYLYQPRLTNTFSFDEYNDRIAGKDSVSTEDQTNFLADNGVTYWLARISFSADSSWVLLERLGADVNVNFCQVLSRAWYHNGTLLLFIDDECYRLNGTFKAVYRQPSGGWVKLTGAVGNLRSIRSTVEGG